MFRVTLWEEFCVVRKIESLVEKFSCSFPHINLAHHITALEKIDHIWELDNIERFYNPIQTTNSKFSYAFKPCCYVGEGECFQACNFIKKRLQHSCFPVNIAKFLRTPILKNICKQLPFKHLTYW